jgi:hypothetical protein
MWKLVGSEKKVAEDFTITPQKQNNKNVFLQKIMNLILNNNLGSNNNCQYEILFTHPLGYFRIHNFRISSKKRRSAAKGRGISHAL